MALQRKSPTLTKLRELNKQLGSITLGAGYFRAVHAKTHTVLSLESIARCVQYGSEAMTSGEKLLSLVSVESICSINGYPASTKSIATEAADKPSVLQAIEDNISKAKDEIHHSVVEMLNNLVLKKESCLEAVNTLKKGLDKLSVKATDIVAVDNPHADVRNAVTIPMTAGIRNLRYEDTGWVKDAAPVCGDLIRLLNGTKSHALDFTSYFADYLESHMHTGVGDLVYRVTDQIPQGFSTSVNGDVAQMSTDKLPGCTRILVDAPLQNLIGMDAVNAYFKVQYALQKADVTGLNEDPVQGLTPHGAMVRIAELRQVITKLEEWLNVMYKETWEKCFNSQGVLALLAVEGEPTPMVANLSQLANAIFTMLLKFIEPIAPYVFGVITSLYEYINASVDNFNEQGDENVATDKP